MSSGVFFAALSAILYGSIGYFSSVFIAHGLSVPDLLLWRFVGSVILLLPFFSQFILTKEELIRRKGALWKLFVLGVILYGCGSALYFEASKLIGTGLAMVIFFAYPLVVAAMSTLVDKAPLSSFTGVALLFIVVGCLLIAGGKDFFADIQGTLLAVVSGIAYGLYVYFSKQASRVVSPVLATFTVCLGATFAFIIYAICIQHNIYVPSNVYLWVHVFLFSLIGTVLPVLFMLKAMKTISASKASIISVLEPVTVLVVGAIILREKIMLLQLAGAVIILSSAIIVQLEKES